LEAFEELRAQESELARLESEMSDPVRTREALERYGTLQEIFDRKGGYTYEARIRHTLSGLGFDPRDHHRPLSQLSGGQRTRALLARLLLSNPDLLVLDEPTNHLDIAAVEWLEGYLNSWDGTAILVSHDRYFLDKVANNIWELTPAGLETYRGNYTAYLGQRQERWARRQEIYEAEKERLEKDLDYIKRNIAGQRTQQAKGKLRRLSREVEAIESLGFEATQGKSWGEISSAATISTHPMGVEEVEKRLHALSRRSNPAQHLRLNLQSERRSGNIVLRASDLVVGYPGDRLFEVGEIELRRLECAAVIGPNGSGKTTFLKTILGQIPPLSGELDLGASLQIGYFAQAHEDLDPGRTLVEEIESLAPGMLLADIRHYLARYLFQGEDVFRKVGTLSGGERGRLALAKLALTGANLLLLDEPTNHLDIPSQEILQQVLSEFGGTILLVSHDRYLIDALATQVWEIEPDENSLTVFKGTYSEYKAQKEAERLALEVEIRESQPAKTPRKGNGPDGDERRREVRRKARLLEVEERIAMLEENLSDLAEQLEKPPSDPELVQNLGEDYVQIQNEIEALLAEWESLQTRA
jgi:ATP-binding cassette subfamily F protein 3